MEKMKCNHCDKIIEGYTKEQVEYMMAQHILSKHKDKIVWRDFFTGKVVESKKEEAHKK